jgi:phthiocerol/phenolphthiocerol synthesis type-I polyketide synthase E
MVGGLRRHSAWTEEHVGVSLLGRAAEPRRQTLLGALGRLWAAGLPVDWEPLFAERPTRSSLPPMPLDSLPLSTSSSRPTPPKTSVRSARAPLAELWCRALGVPSAKPEDSFFQLGGESLSLVRLLRDVREQTGVRIAVAELLDKPTFGRLVELVGQPTGPSAPESPNLLRLHDPASERAPLFLAASGTGTSLCYQYLAPLLGDRPVYGLEAPGLHDGLEPLDRFETLARENLALLRSVQPHGPYRLGGWSLGAMLAHEMATQLIEQGEQVETLLCIDGFVPWTRGLPIGTRPAYLVGGLRSRAQTALGRTGQLTAALRLNETDAVGEEFIRVYNANMLAVLRYVPKPVDCAAVVFKTGLTPRSRPRLLRATSPLYLGGVRAHGVPGDHWSVLDRRFAGALAEKMRAVLDEHEEIR